MVEGALLDTKIKKFMDKKAEEFPEILSDEEKQSIFDIFFKGDSRHKSVKDMNFTEYTATHHLI